jgi:hypothetical protein
LMKTKISI